MVKTTPLNDDTHKCLKVAQTILYEKYNIEIPIPEIIAAVIVDPEQVVKTILEKKGIIEQVDKSILEKKGSTNIELIEKEEVYAE